MSIAGTSTQGTASRIVGWGSALPPKVVTNVDLEAMLDTSDEWIRTRTGIVERRVGGTSSSLAVEAGAAALECAGMGPEEVDLLILATSSADQIMPASAPVVARELGLTCGAYDLNAACSGFVYALVNGYAMTGVGHRRVLVVGADVLTQWLDWDDRSTAVLFGDGAGAVVLAPGERPTLLGSDLGADGSAAHHLYIDHGGTLKMDGQEIFRRAVRAMTGSAEIALDRAGLEAAEIDLVVPHQANLRIIDSACRKLGIDVDRCAMVVDRTGNTSAGSVPLALVDAIAHDRLTPGDNVLFSGFGAGMTWASAIVRWDA